MCAFSAAPNIIIIIIRMLPLSNESKPNRAAKNVAETRRYNSAVVSGLQVAILRF